MDPLVDFHNRYGSPQVGSSVGVLHSSRLTSIVPHDYEGYLFNFQAALLVYHDILSRTNAASLSVTMICVRYSTYEEHMPCSGT